MFSSLLILFCNFTKFIFAFEISLEMYRTELVFSIGKNFSMTSVSLEKSLVIKRRVFLVSIFYKILEDVQPEGFRFFTLEVPETEDMF